MNVAIQQATRHDAPAIEKLEREFADYLFSTGDTSPRWLDAETYLKDGFGTEPLFFGLVAELEGVVVGHLFYHHGYDIDRGGRIFYILDLFVTTSARRKGIGRALMEEAADICQRYGGKGLLWGVFLKNKPSIDFYKHLRAEFLQHGDMAYMYWGIKEA